MQRIQTILFPCLFFLSASLVFSIQPILGKMMLPHVGGSPAGWVVAMAFFQIALLAGYGIAHIGSKLNVFTQSIMTIILLIIGLTALPVNFDGSSIIEATGISAGTVFMELVIVVSLPFIALSSITPAIQRVFSAGSHHTAKDPYYLYAASNLGSFFGLLSYPFLIEPLMSLSEQAHLWKIFYWALIGFCTLTCAQVFIEKRSLIKIGFGDDHLSEEEQRGVAPLTFKQCMSWLLLAAAPSSLILGVTLYITTNIAPIPLLWIIPLALYLLSHIVAFSKRNAGKSIEFLAYIHVIVVGLTIAVYVIDPIYIVKSATLLTLTCFILLSSFYITALLLHKKLAESRPHAKHLTAFYFMLSLGGAIGGSFNAFVAPSILSDNYEFPIILALSLLLNPLTLKKLPAAALTIKSKATSIGFTALGVGAFYISKEFTENNWIEVPTASIFFICMLLGIARPRTMAVTAVAVITIQILVLTPNQFDSIHRNFFGISKVMISNDGLHLDADTKTRIKTYTHGNTIHGIQAIEEPFDKHVFSYYPPVSPVGSLFHATSPKSTLVVGLGAGVMACHQNYFPGMVMDFIEIDPYVAKIAKEDFSFLEKCGYGELWIGDGRLIAEDIAKKKKYDFIMLDAFSSDAVPVHLLTIEAIQLYMDMLTNDGVLLFNISNRYLNLKKPLGAIANAIEKPAYNFFYVSDRENTLTFDSNWITLLKTEKFSKKLEEMGWKESKTQTVDEKPWSDNYSPVLSILYLDQQEMNDVFKTWREPSKELRAYMEEVLEK